MTPKDVQIKWRYKKTLVSSFKSSLGERDIIKGVCAFQQAPVHHGCVSWCSDVLEVLLDAPQCVCTLLQLGHFIIRQGHVDHAAHTGAVQHAGQRQEDFLVNTEHILQKQSHMSTELAT